MNVFFTDSLPHQAAMNLCDKHVPKMLLESIQMLCTAHHACGSGQDWMYQPAYVNHPCTIWARSSANAYIWLLEHADGINAQYEFRFRGKHACGEILTKLGKYKLPSGISMVTTMLPAQAMPDQYKHEDAVTAYRQYYIGEKARFAKWEKGIHPPSWWPKSTNSEVDATTALVEVG